MGIHSDDVLAELRDPTRQLRHAIPDAWAAFVSLHGAAVAEGSLSTGFKEAVALAIGVVKRCDGCIAYHAKAAVRAGATDEEIAEVLAVTLLMDGGTASVYAPRAWAAVQEFRTAATALANSA